MPLPSTTVFHPQWSALAAETTDEAENVRIQIIEGLEEGGWQPGVGVVPGTENVLYDGRARMTYDRDRAITKDNADQVTSTGSILVALPRGVNLDVQPGSTVRIIEGDVNGPLGEFVKRTLRVLTVRVSGFSWGTVLDCHESRGRSNG